MRITIRHRFDFGEDRELVGRDLRRPEAWDALRTETEGPFALPSSRREWEDVADARDELRDRAAAIDSWLEREGCASLASYGVGAGVLELWLRRIAPARELVVTEYAPETVRRLAAMFEGVEVKPHDLLRDPPEPAEIHLFHRVDTEFTNRQWRSILRRFGSQRVILIPSEIIDLRGAISAIRAKRRMAGAARAGLIRNRASFESLWKRTHLAESLRLADLDGWILTPKARS